MAIERPRQGMSGLLGTARRRRALFVVGAASAALFAFTVVRAELYAATATISPTAVYLGDSNALVTVTVHNTGTGTSIGAVEIRRPDNGWSFTACESGPAGWSIQNSTPHCRYRSSASGADDIQPGASATFTMRVSVDPGSANRKGTFQVTVSRSDKFDNPSLLAAAAEGAGGLDVTAHSFQVLDAVVANVASTPGTACPPANKQALVDSTKVIVICGRNRANVALTPNAANSSLSGTFLQSSGTFSSAQIAANSASSVVLGNWNGAKVRSTSGSNLTIVAVIGASATQNSPSTTLTGYTATNNPPVAGDDGPYSVLEDQQLNVAAPGVRANDSEPDGQAFTVAITQNPAHGDATLSNDGSFTYDPDPDYFGSDSFVYTADDGHGGTDTATVSIDVTPVNDAPSFSLPSPSDSSNEDSGVQSVAGFATSISAGPANESGQAVNFTLTNSNPGLFAQPPAISPTGTLTYQASADAFGSATLTATLHDDGGNANGGSDTSASVPFTITVNPVNDAPGFNLPANPDQTVNESAGPQTVASFATSITAGPANESSQIVHFNVSNDNIALFSGQPAIANDGTLTYEPADGASGNATVTVAAQDDGGIANGGVDTSAAQTFMITVTGVNDAPTAADQSFGTAVGNTLFAVSRPATAAPVVHATGNLLDGASDPDGPTPLQVIAGTFSTTGGGTATLYADGTFTYESAAGFRGSSDSFDYQIEDGDGAQSDPATVQIGLSGDVVWYVDGAAVAGGDGRSTAPFTSLGALQGAGDPDQANDILFVYSGNYAGAFTLETDEQLIGQPAGLNLVSQDVVLAGGTRPNLSGASGTGLTLASGVSVSSIGVSGASGDGIGGVSLGGTVTLADVEVSGSGLDNARLSASAGSLTLNVSDSTFRNNNAVTGSHGLRLTATAAATITATIDGDTFRGNRIAGVQASTAGGGTLDLTVTDGTFDTNFNGVDLTHASTGSLTSTVSGNTMSTTAVNAGAPINLFLSNLAGSAASSVFRATVDNNVISNNASIAAPGVWYHTGTSAGHARLLITNNSLSNLGQRGILVEAGPGSSTVDSTVLNNAVSVVGASALEGIYVQGGLASTDTVAVCADIRSNTAASPSSDIRVRQRFANTTFALPGYIGLGVNDAAVQAFLAAQNTVNDVLASHQSLLGFAGGGSCAQP